MKFCVVIPGALMRTDAPANVEPGNSSTPDPSTSNTIPFDFTPPAICDAPPPTTLSNVTEDALGALIWTDSLDPTSKLVQLIAALGLDCLMTTPAAVGAPMRRGSRHDCPARRLSASARLQQPPSPVHRRPKQRCRQEPPSNPHVHRSLDWPC